MPEGLSLDDKLGLGVSIVGIILGVGVSIFLYLISRRRVQPFWAIWTKSLVDASQLDLPKLHLRYEEETLQRLYASRIVVWNGGSETLASRHVIDRLLICHAEDGVILDHKLAAQSVEDNRIELDCSEDRKGVQIDFQYLGSGQFGVVDLLHSGDGSSLLVTGAIEGAHSGIRRLYPERQAAGVAVIGGFFLGSLLALVLLEDPLGQRFFPVAFVAGLIVTWWASRKATRLPSPLLLLAEPPHIGEEVAWN